MEQRQRILRKPIQARESQGEVGGATGSRLHRVLIRHAEVAVNTRSTAFAEDKSRGDGLAAKRLVVVNLTCPKRRNNMVVRTSPRTFLQPVGG